MLERQIISLIIDGTEVNTTWEQLASWVHQSSHLQQSFSTGWVVIRAIQIFLVQIGMLLMEVGSISPKNTKAMIIKNIGNSSLSALSFYLLGYAFSFGKDGDDFVGWGGFATRGEMFDVSGSPGNVNYNGASFAHFVYYFSLLNLVPTIVSGSLSERTHVVAYFVTTCLISLFISPVLFHWAWSHNGWASLHSRYLMDTGVLDFAGSSVVHVSGGVMALIGAVVVGPRQGRFSGDSAQERMPRQNVTYSALGAFFTWAGFYALNMGTIENFTGDGVNALGKIALNTTICAAASSVTVTVFTLWRERNVEPYSVANGICAGLAGSSAGCATITTEGALVTGILCGAVYYLLSWMLCSFKVDDVSDVSPIHIGGGVVGVITAAFFTPQQFYKIAILDSGDLTPCGAFFVCNGLGWRQLVANLIFLVAVVAWSAVAGLAVFVPLRIMSLLRVNKVHEDHGLDFMAGPAAVNLR